MTALVLSALLAFQTAAVPATAPATTAPSPAPTLGAGTGFEPIVRRGPQSAPQIVQTNEDAVIQNSGSTNTSGYTIVVHDNDTADVYEGGPSRHVDVGKPQAAWLFAKLKEAQPLESLGAMHCMKSASFGTRTTISFEGKSTPDLSCGGGDASRELMRTIGVIMNQLGVRTGFGRLRNRL